MKHKLLVKSSISAVLLSMILVCVGFAAGGDGRDRANERADDFQTPSSEMRPLVERYDADRMLLLRSDRTPVSPAVLERMQKFYTGWQAEIAKVDFDSMHQDGKIDYILLKNTLNHELRGIELRRKEMAETAPLLPFAPTIVGLAEALRHMENSGRGEGGGDAGKFEHAD